MKPQKAPIKSDMAQVLLEGNHQPLSAGGDQRGYIVKDVKNRTLLCWVNIVAHVGKQVKR